MKQAFGLFLYSDNELKPLIDIAMIGFRCEKRDDVCDISDAEIVRLAEQLLMWKFTHYLPGDLKRLTYAIMQSLLRVIPSRWDKNALSSSGSSSLVHHLVSLAKSEPNAKEPQIVQRTA
jgi:hypothetical protein